MALIQRRALNAAARIGAQADAPTTNVIDGGGVEIITHGAVCLCGASEALASGAYFWTMALVGCGTCDSGAKIGRCCGCGCRGCRGSDDGGSLADAAGADIILGAGQIIGAECPVLLWRAGEADSRDLCVHACIREFHKRGRGSRMGAGMHE